MGSAVQVTTISQYSSVTSSMKNGVSSNVSSTEGATSSQSLQGPSSSDSIEKQFLELANMNPMDRMRAGILKSMGLTEDDLKSMSPQQRQDVEQKIREMIEQEFQKNTDKKGQLVDVSA